MQKYGVEILQAQIKSLDPQISVSPQGNDGVTGYANDGRIIFTPNKAMQVDSSVSSFEVQVKCTVKGASATETYTVLVTQYAVIPVEVDQEIVKTQFFDNQVGASFYVTKDGVRREVSVTAALQGGRWDDAGAEDVTVESRGDEALAALC